MPPTFIHKKTFGVHSRPTRKPPSFNTSLHNSHAELARHQEEIPKNNIGGNILA